MASKFILAQGLKPMQRLHVHLSCDVKTAKSVGRRYGQPVILTINAKAMYQNGFDFYQADNGVWLTSIVPAQYLQQNE